MAAPEQPILVGNLSPELKAHSPYEYIPGTDVREPISGREAAYRPYEATSLIYDEKHQDDVWIMMDQLIHHELGDQVSQKTVEFILHSIRHRMIARDGSNASSYNVRLNKKPVTVSSEIKEACRRTELGLGTMQDIDLARRSFGMPSVEYGNLTIIGDKRLEYLSAMYEEASELLGDRRATSDTYGARIIGFDRNPSESNHIGAIRVQMKRHLGTLDDGTEVKQRTLAIIDLSPSSGFDQDIVREIIKVHKTITDEARESQKIFDTFVGIGSDFSLQEATKSSRIEDIDIISETHGLQRALEALVKINLDHPLILARNETIYGYNRSVDAEIRRVRQEQSLGRLAVS